MFKLLPDTLPLESTVNAPVAKEHAPLVGLSENRFGTEEVNVPENTMA